MFTPTHSSFATFGRNDQEEKEPGDGNEILFLLKIKIVGRVYFKASLHSKGYFRVD